MNPKKPLAALAAALVLGTAISTVALASSHREAPGIAKDPTADNTDVYAFMSPDRPGWVTLISNWLPLLEPAGGPNFFAWDDDAVYTINIDNVGDCQDHIVYQFYFKTHVRNGNTFLYNTGPVTSPDDPDLNVYQTYSVKKIVNGVESWVGENLRVQPNRVGPKSTPKIADLADASVHTLSDGSKVFSGEIDDPFFVDLGAIFDLLTIRRLPGDLGRGQDGLRGFNTLSIALQVKVSDLTRDGLPATETAQPVLGVYSTTMREGRQVSRLGNPLVNEVVIPLKDKDKFNASRPTDDGQFLSYVTNPELAGLLNALYGISVPPTPRNDLVAVFLTGVPGLTQPANGAACEMLRLNVSIPASPSPSRLGVLAGDLAGFPNGRRLADDVTDIALRAVAGVLVEGFNIEPNRRLGDGVDFNERTFQNKFPYVARPFDPFAHSHHRTEPASGPGPAAQRVGSGHAHADDDGSIEIESEDYMIEADAADLLQLASPNPASKALLRYTLSRNAKATLQIYDLQGRKVRSLIDRDLNAGSFTQEWDGTNENGERAGKGVFFARFSMDGTVVNIKKLVIR